MLQKGPLMKYRKRIPALLPAFLFLVFTVSESLGTDKIDQVRFFIIDPPTLECLGFRWYIYGDDNGNATVAINYRKKGDSEWKKALPMLRVNREVTNWDFEPYASDNMFAGSIFSLENDSDYEVSCRMSDPDGGKADTTVVVHTRSVPVAPKPLRTLHLYSGGKSGSRDSFNRFSDLAKILKPGDLALIHGGIHNLGPGGVKITVSGTPKNPIVFRAAGDGGAVLDAGNSETIFDIRNINHLFFENLAIRNGGFAFRADGASWLTVTRCAITDVVMGFYSYSELSENWYVADNIITGHNPAWHPRQEENPSHTGAKIYGRGHVFCYNKVSKFWDCLAIANYGKPQHDFNLKCVAIDFYNNELTEAVDDCIESDYGCHNIRMFRNRLSNSFTGLSAQPTYGGPVYFIRNEVYNATGLPLKLHNWCAGLEIFHNTLITPRAAFRSYARWQNGILRNNLFLGVSGYAVETGSPSPKTTLDYNGYRKADPERLFKWYDGKSEQRYPTLEAFTKGAGFEKHGIMVDFDIFTRTAPPKEGNTYTPADYDLTLKPGAVAVDAGEVLPNINDGFSGKAPDLGCYESGQPLPHYGPRK